MEAPFFRARRRGDGFVVEGTASCLLGHELASEPGDEPEGIWARWRWDGRRLVAENDRLGYRPLFYAVADAEIALSPSIAELVRRGAGTELDEVALAVFRYLDYFIEDDTPFRSIRTLPPGGRLVWDGTATLETRPPLLGQPLAIEREEAVREFVRLFHEALERRIDRSGRVVLPLSGGHDSRQILLALCELGAPPGRCVSVEWFPPVDTDDVPVAAAVSARLGIPHAVVPQLPRFEAERRKNLATHFLADEHAWFVVLGEYLDREADTTYHGIGGDVLARAFRQPPRRLARYRDGRLSEVVTGMIRTRDSRPRSPSPFLESPEVRRAALERIERALACLASSPNPLTAFAIRHSTRREYALMPAAMVARATCSCPYLDRRLVAFMLSLPPELTRDGRFHDDAIALAYPVYADLPYGRTGRRKRTIGDWGPFALRLARYGLGRDPRRAAALARALARWAGVAAIPGRWRGGHPWDLEWLLYAWQLEELTGRRL